MNSNTASILQFRSRQQQPDTELMALLDLILNNLDGFSVALFVTDKSKGPLHLKTYRSLSDNIDPQCTIYPGQGLIGWVHKMEKQVNIDRVTFVSDRLMFYTCDENIKSFMAIPLPDIDGVLAVDSKQRYFFTDKSIKLLNQFGQSISKVWLRLFGQPVLKKTAAVKGSLSRPDQPKNEICALWQSLEYCLTHSDYEGGGLDATLKLIQNFTGMTWAFLTVVKNIDKRHYHLVASSDNVPDNTPTKYPMGSGLAGWVHTNLKPLAIDRIKSNARNSCIFQRNESLESFRSFYGWPLIYNEQSRGALMLVGRDEETLTPALIEIMECVAQRLAGQLHLDRLIFKVLEMENIDTQTGLAHRGHFLDHVGYMMKVADMKGEGVDLYVLATSGLGAFACEYGQGAADDILRSMANEIKAGILSTWRIGHLSYGVFTLATPSADGAEAKKLIGAFKKKLSNWPLNDTSGRVNFGLIPALTSYPGDGQHPEQLLELALTTLAEA